MLMLSFFKKQMQKQTSEQEFGTSFLSSKAISKLYPRARFIRELETNHGRPDAVLFNSQSKKHSVMNAIQNSPSTNVFAKVFFAMKTFDHNFTSNEIVIRSGVPANSVKQVISALIKEGMLLIRDSSYTLSDKANLPNTSIISIEFKLHDWKKALQQALRHKAFADKAYVIMPESKSKLLETNLSIFEEFGVSVAVYDVRRKKLTVLLDIESESKSPVSRIDLIGRLWLNKQFIGIL